MEEEEEGTRRPHMAARSLLTRGPPEAEPSEARAKSVPVGKRTVLEVQEKVAPRRAGEPAVRAPRSRVHEADERRTRALLPWGRLGRSGACGVGRG